MNYPFSGSLPFLGRREPVPMVRIDSLFFFYVRNLLRINSNATGFIMRRLLSFIHLVFRLRLVVGDSAPGHVTPLLSQG